MKNLFLKFALLLLIAAFISSCEKENNPMEVELPNDISIGEMKIYMNGELKPGFSPIFDYTEIIEDFGFSFIENVRPNQQHAIGFNWMPLKVGRYPIGKPAIFHEIATASFSQTFEEHITGNEYELIESEQGYFEIELIDTLKQEVKGHFKAKFRRDGKNKGKDLDLPKVILMQGMFYMPYEVY